MHFLLEKRRVKFQKLIDGWIGIDVPNGSALEKMMTAINKLMVGSQKALYFQSVNQIINPVAITPTLPRASPMTWRTSARMFIEPWACECPVGFADSPGPGEPGECPRCC